MKTLVTVSPWWTALFQEITELLRHVAFEEDREHWESGFEGA